MVLLRALSAHSKRSDFPNDYVMADRWTGWKSFPDDYHGEYIQAPMGPGAL